MFSPRLKASIVVGAAAVAIAGGVFAIVDSVSGTGVSGTASAAPSAHSGPNQQSFGQIPQGWRPGTGTIITGAAADEAEAAALAKYPGGTVNRVLELSDGSYAVHMIDTSWPHHVFVSQGFIVTGAIG
jgi:hypothetical protein